MGIKLIIGVMDHAPESLTWRERWVLAVLAEDANEHTHLTFVGYEGDDPASRRFRARTGCSRSQYYATLKALIEKKAIEPTQRGQKGVRAHYRILPAALQGPDFQDAETEPQRPGFEDADGGSQGPGNQDPVRGAQGPVNRDADAGRQGPGNRDAEPPFSVPVSETQGPSSERSGSRFPTFRVPETGTPTPQSPKTFSSSVPAEYLRAAGAQPEEERELTQWIRDKHDPRGPGWWRHVAENGDLAAIVNEWRSQRTPTPPRRPPAAAAPEPERPIHPAYDDKAAHRAARATLAPLSDEYRALVLAEAARLLAVEGYRPTVSAQYTLAAELLRIREGPGGQDGPDAELHLPEDPDEAHAAAREQLAAAAAGDWGEALAAAHAELSQTALGAGERAQQVRAAEILGAWNRRSNRHNHPEEGS